VIDLSGSKGKIVTYEPSMAKEVAEMFNRFKESWPGGFGGGVPFDEERVRDWLDESSAIVDFIALDQDNTPVGYCNLVPHWKESDASHVELLSVIPRVLGKKFGKRLLLKAIDRASKEGFKRVDLHTWSGNLEAVPLYKKVGMFWVPDTTVYMQDYIPLLHQNDLTKEWMEAHPDWYQNQKRELKQEPNDLTVDEMKIFRYRFEDEGDWLEVDIDRYGWGITAIRSKLDEKEFSIKAKVDSHDIDMGIENHYQIDIKNGTEEDKEIEIEVNPFDGLEFNDDFPRSVTVKKGETKTVSREFLVSKEAETFESSHEKSETIDTKIKMDEKEFKLTTGGKIKPAVEIKSQRDLHYLFDGKEKEVYFDLKNNTERSLSGEIEYKIGDEVGTTDFILDEKENGGFKLPLKIDFEDEQVKNIELTPSIEKEDGLFPMESYIHPLVHDIDGLLTGAEKKDEVFMVNNELKVKIEVEGGEIKAIEGTRDSEFPFEIRQQIGPPFGRTQDSSLKYNYDFERTDEGLLLTLKVESVHKPGVQIKKFLILQKHSSEVEFWSELKNVDDSPLECATETGTRKWGFDTEPYQSKGRIYTPLGDEIIESDPVADMLSSTMVPMDPKKWNETWTAYEDIADGAVTGMIWDNENIKKIKLANGMLNELRSITKELEPGESFKSTHLWISAKKSSLNSFRDTWNRLVGKTEKGPNERIHGKESRDHIEVNIDDNILKAGEETERNIIIDKVVDYPMPGEYSISSSEAINVSFTNDEDTIKISKEYDGKKIHLPIKIKTKDKTRSDIAKIVLHYSGERELDFEIPVIITKGDKVKISKNTKEGEKVLHIDNGKIQFDVMDGFGGNLIKLVNSNGDTYLADTFPEPQPKSYFENHIGGLQPRLMTPEDFYSFYEIEDVSSKKYSRGKWKGVEIDFDIEKLDSLRGQNFSIRYLTLPGTKLIKIKVVNDNPKVKEVNWFGEFFIDVLLNGSLEDTIVKCPGKYEDWERSYQTQQFSPPPNIEKPWFMFKKDDISLAGFGVEGSNAFSSVICNEEINMAFLVPNMVSQAKQEHEVEMGIILDADEEEIERARRAIKS